MNDILKQENSDNPFAIRILDPKSVRVFRENPKDVTVRMTLDDDRSWRSVFISRAFPFSDPDHYIGLRDGDDGDIGIIKDTRELDYKSQAVIEQELNRRYFTPKVKKVISVEEEHGTVTWRVETDRGPRRFVVRDIRDNAFPLGPLRLLLNDSEGSRYEFPDITALGARAYNVLIKVM